LNVLGGPDPDLVVDNLVGISRNIFSGYWGPRTDDTARLLGSFIVAAVWQAATHRARLGQVARVDAALYVDECQNYLNLPRSFEELLAEARGYRLSLVLAHQHLAQLPRELRDAVSSNARTKVWFSMSPEDAHALARHVAPEVSEHDLAHLGVYQAAARIVVDGQETPACTLRTRPPRPPSAAAPRRLQPWPAPPTGGPSSPPQSGSAWISPPRRCPSTPPSPTTRSAGEPEPAPQRRRLPAGLPRVVSGLVSAIVSGVVLSCDPPPDHEPPRRRAWRGVLAEGRQRGERGRSVRMRKEASPGERRLGAARTRGRDDRLYDLAGRLTERDRRICWLLYDHRVLTTAQVADVGFDSLRKAQERLSILYALEVVDRFRLHSWSGTSPYHLVLGTAGAALIAAERGVTLADLAWHKETATALSTNRQLAHLVGCNGVLTALLRTARTRPGCHLDEWWSARRCAAAWGEIVRPDAYAVWVEHGVRLPFFLEYDTGTEALRRLAGKLDGYARLARAVGHPTWVLFAFPSVGREAAARRVLRHPVVPVATAVLGPHTAPDGPVWQAIGDQRAAGRLVDLGHVLHAHSRRPSPRHTAGPVLPRPPAGPHCGATPSGLSRPTPA
jgi:hypothetical protein